MTEKIIIGKFPKKQIEEKIDLAWAREHIAGFAKMEAMAIETKKSEAEYKNLLGKKK